MDNKQDEIEQLEFDDEQEVKSTEPVEKINEPINQNRPIPNQQVAPIESDRLVDKNVEMSDHIEVQASSITPQSPIQIHKSKDPEEKIPFAKKIYLSYVQRLVLLLILFVVVLFCFFSLTLESFALKKPEAIKYTDTQETNYRVYLKQNNFYEQDYLEEDMMYVANLIDKISIDFNYKFNIEKKSTVDFNYKVIGDLIIANSQTKVNYFEKEYTLYEAEQETMKDNKEYAINQNVEIDYGHFNDLANSFRTSYGVNSDSYLKVYLQVMKDGKKYNVDLANESESGITIPLSENSVQIKFDSDDLSKSNEITMERALIFTPKIITFEIITFVLSVFLLVKIIRLIAVSYSPKSIYDKYIDDILKTYDRLIVETETGLDLEKYNVMEIGKFEELLDVRDNLKLPIMYYNIAKHQKCYFYIKNNEDVYIMRVKAVDLEEANQVEKKDTKQTPELRTMDQNNTFSI